MEFKLIKDQINELEYQETNDLLTARGLNYLKELKLILKQREDMLEMIKTLMKYMPKNTIEDANMYYKAMQLIKEATEL